VVQGLHHDFARRIEGRDRRGAQTRVKVTAHLCSVTAREAVALGIET